jgi:hypothetical protein
VDGLLVTKRFGDRGLLVRVNHAKQHQSCRNDPSVLPEATDGILEPAGWVHNWGQVQNAQYFCPHADYAQYEKRDDFRSKLADVDHCNCTDNQKVQACARYALHGGSVYHSVALVTLLQNDLHK